MKEKGFKVGPNDANFYSVLEDTVDISRMPVRQPRLGKIKAEPVDVRIDLSKTAIVIIDMQNDFLTEGGMVSEAGGDYRKLRQPIEPLYELSGKLREIQVPVIWVNWGNRPDRRNLPPGLLYSFNRHGAKGLGDSLQSRQSNILEKDSWSAAIVDELYPDAADVFIDKYRVSGFWDTPLDSILRYEQINTLLFAGVNADQCVMCTMQDATFLGYDTILLSDCIATTSPDYCMKATLYNAKIMGFVTDSMRFIEAMA